MCQVTCVTLAIVCIEDVNACVASTLFHTEKINTLLFSRNQYLQLFTTGKQAADKLPTPGHVQQPTRGVVSDDNQGAFTVHCQHSHWKR